MAPSLTPHHHHHPTLCVPRARSPPSYLSLARFNAKFERAYVEQAREDVQWERRQKECLDGERDLMKGVKGWVVGSRRFFTQWEDKPDKDVLDPRVRAQALLPALVRLPFTLCAYLPSHTLFPDSTSPRRGSGRGKAVCLLITSTTS